MHPLILVGIFEVKHLIADFFLQSEYHLGKFKKEGWELPLASHCFVHASITFFIVCCVNYNLWWLALVDFWAHFIMDRIKASPDLLGRFKPLTSEQYAACKTDMDNFDISRPETLMAEMEAHKALRSNKLFWWCLGVDQWVHKLTSLGIVACLLK